MAAVVPIVSSQRFPQLGSKQFWPGVTGRLALFLTILVILGLPLPAAWARMVTLAELRDTPNLTPERLMAFFADFKFELSRQVQAPETFLANRAGDCDDFATLAADLLRERGYTTRLIVVYMPHDVHVVCYVGETRNYLDYNRRKEASPLVKCDSDLGAIANSVSQSFRCPWRSASEFTFHNGAKRFVSTVFR